MNIVLVGIVTILCFQVKDQIIWDSWMTSKQNEEWTVSGTFILSGVVGLHRFLRIHQSLFNVEIPFVFNAFIFKDNIMKLNIIRKRVKLSI